jgi:glycosyltransferase involved in cell wall biosynthesis
MSARMPTVSVIIPTYQRAHIVGQSITSVLHQTHQHFELLVVDDGSTDGTVDMVSRINDSRLRVLAVEHGGRSRARNHGVANATGEAIVFLDSDDRADPRWLEQICAPFNSPTVGVVCCGARLSDPRNASHGDTERIMKPAPADSAYSSRVGHFLAGTFAVRRSVFQAVGGYDCRLDYSENTELAIRLAIHCERHRLSFATVDMPLVSIETRPVSNGRAHFRARLDAAELMLRQYGDRYRTARRSFHASLRGVAAVNAARLGLSTLAIRHSVAATAADPTRAVHWGRLALTMVPPLARRFWTRRLESQ